MQGGIAQKCVYVRGMSLRERKDVLCKGRGAVDGK